jgi:hypothetical protein
VHVGSLLVNVGDEPIIVDRIDPDVARGEVSPKTPSRR